MKHIRTLIVAGGIAAASVMSAYAADISGAGATFPYPIYAKWADAYKKESGNGLNYQSIGSGGGITQIIGTGGRDLHERVGGIMMIDGIKNLAPTGVMRLS